MEVNGSLEGKTEEHRINIVSQSEDYHNQANYLAVLAGTCTSGPDCKQKSYNQHDKSDHDQDVENRNFADER